MIQGDSKQTRLGQKAEGLDQKVLRLGEKVVQFDQKVSMGAITEGEAIRINEGKRSAGKRGRGIGIRVCVGKNEYPLMKEVKTERPAKNAGRASR